MVQAGLGISRNTSGAASTMNISAPKKKKKPMVSGAVKAGLSAVGRAVKPNVPLTPKSANIGIRG